MLWTLLLMVIWTTTIDGQQGVPPVGSEYNDKSPDGSYRFGFQTGDLGGHYEAVVATKDNSVAGKFGSRDPAKGQVVETQFTAGKRGYRPRGPNVARKYDLSQNKIPYNPPVNPSSPNYNPTLEGYHDPNEDPSYSFEFRTPTYTKNEAADSRGHVNGLYSFVDDVGERHDVSYEAGAKIGFNVKTPFPDSKVFSGTFYRGPPSKLGSKSVRGKTSIQQRNDGSYRFVSAGPDQRRTEVSDSSGNRRGSYTYIDDKGQQRTVEYIAGPNIGYRIVSKGLGVKFPTAAPFIPPRYPDFPSGFDPSFPTEFPPFSLDGDGSSGSKRPGSSGAPGLPGSNDGGSGGSSSTGGGSDGGNFDDIFGAGGASGNDDDKGGNKGDGGFGGGSQGGFGGSGLFGNGNQGSKPGKGGASGQGGYGDGTSNFGSGNGGFGSSGNQGGQGGSGQGNFGQDSSFSGGQGGSGNQGGFGGSPGFGGGSSNSGGPGFGSGSQNGGYGGSGSGNNNLGPGYGPPTSERPGTSSTPGFPDGFFSPSTGPTTTNRPSTVGYPSRPSTPGFGPTTSGFGPTTSGFGPTTSTSDPFNGYPDGRPPFGSPTLTSSRPGYFPPQDRYPPPTTSRPPPYGTDSLASAFPEDDPSRPPRPLRPSLEDDFLQNSFKDLPKKFFNHPTYFKPKPRPGQRQEPERDDSTFLSSDKRFYSFPPGVAVRAHVQSLDILPYGSRIPSPGFALEHSITHSSGR